MSFDINQGVQVMLATILPHQVYAVRTSETDTERELSYASLLAMRQRSAIKLFTTKSYEEFEPGRKRPSFVGYEYAGSFTLQSNWRRRAPGLLVTHGFIATWSKFHGEELNLDARLMLIHQTNVPDINFYVPKLSLIVSREA
jgi:hypothetical protein